LTETDGYFNALPGQPRLIGTNRFGHILEVRAGTGADGRPSVSCTTLRGTRSTPAGWVWLRFEDALNGNQLLFSEQAYDQGSQWRLGAPLVALDSETLGPSSRLPDGAPASVSPDGTLIAALAREGEAVTVIVYRSIDQLQVFKAPISGRVTPNPVAPNVPLNDWEWEELAPAWSKDGRYLLVKRYLGVANVRADIFSPADITAAPLLVDLESVRGYYWAADNRLVVEQFPVRVAVYEMVD
jgi:hypothetical protein